MHLAQHHFQAQSRSFEERLRFTLSRLFFKPYGVAACELDADALLNGTISVRHARGMMPDGLPFSLPEGGAPATLSVRGLPSSAPGGHLVLLAIPAERPGHANLMQDPVAGREGGRYRAERVLVRDVATGRDPQPIEVARTNFQLVLDTSPADGLVTLPLARVQRAPAGHLFYDPAYVPPCLRIGASERLMQLLGELVDVLDAKVASLGGDGHGARAASGYGADQIGNAWMTHAIRSSQALLRHHQQLQDAHPEQLFVALSRLAGALFTFSLRGSPLELPLYDHDDPSGCFAGLDRIIREHLDTVVPSNRISIPLERLDADRLLAASGSDEPTTRMLRAFFEGSADRFFGGTLGDRRCFGGAEWYLGVRATGSAAELVVEVPRRVKICSMRHIARLVMEGMPGVALEPVGSPPAALAPQRHMQYFRLNSGAAAGASGPCWRSMVDSGSVGIYAPATIQDAELELVVVLQA
jgi:type VI secretion system protein ImpJ